MPIEALKALIEDGGGYDNVVRLIFDNAIHTNFVIKPEEEKLKESDFVELGGTWFYKEKMYARSIDTYDYDIETYTYHPLDCLQAVIMSAGADRIDIMYMSDMMAQLTS